ncbi:hypothetical protein BDV27DRAFT_133248 [Aspergillus caelatus]|uniref:Uncharacterized protein n=1 Tax=Aspergillus caelatus TaxID=61420 RepID=A0A5N6ZUN0_9EURO|nr:uncharacterized protein BDV27DRAFT_133248 [Aspergillus caelatus]KAE8361321.1 hypothetical protein BDV27DRAFT_133248 [Aspergillus caelatus]
MLLMSKPQSRRREIPHPANISTSILLFSTKSNLPTPPKYQQHSYVPSQYSAVSAPPKTAHWPPYPPSLTISKQALHVSWDEIASNAILNP